MSGDEQVAENSHSECNPGGNGALVDSGATREMDPLRKIFLLLPTGITVRNFLTTGILDRLLLQRDVLLVVFTRAPEVVRQHPIKSDRLIVERLPGRRVYSLTNLLHAVIRRRFYRTHETTSLGIFAKGPLSPHRREQLVETLLSQPLPRNRTIYRCLRALGERVNGVSDTVRELFVAHEPSLVVSTHPTTMDEYEFLRHARRTGVTSVGMIKSWDTLTTKGYLPVVPDYFLAWNCVIQEEIRSLHEVSPDRVSITGVPQFDPYAETAGATPRQDWMRRLRLDPAKKTILFATSAPWINGDDPETLRRLAVAFGREKLESVQILARLHPIDTMERYQGVRGDNLAFQVPGAMLGDTGDRRMMDPDFTRDLRDTLLHSDVVLNTCSTTNLDAVAMDRPVVNIAFDLEPKGYYQSCRRYYDFDHFRPIRESGATQIAESFDELVSLTERYLDSPELEGPQRARLRDMLCYKVDGRSAERVAHNLLARLP